MTTSLQYLKGVGPARAPILERLGLRTVEDLIYDFPRSYLDLDDRRAIRDLQDGVLQTVRGTIIDLDIRDVGPGRCIAGAMVDDGTDLLRLIWFNQTFMFEKFPVGTPVLVSGKPRRHAGRWEMTHPRVQTIHDRDAEPLGTAFVPVYSLAEGLRQQDRRRMAQNALEIYLDEVPEVFPPEYRVVHQLGDVHQSLADIHFPRDREARAGARRRLVYEEFLLLQLALAIRSRDLKDDRDAPPLPCTPRIDSRIRRLFPFELTPGQDRAVTEVCADLARSRPMNRLLQGDVGSGKTAVAVYAMLLAVAHNFQAALMAPTEILARQHARTLDRYLAHSRVRRLLLTGGGSDRERAEHRDAIARGAVDLVVGTQAVIQGDVEFARLALVVIDEQHKFGVRQRASLRSLGPAPHYLVMTATPIPRTLTMTTFGDLDCSTIRDLPPGRRGVRTYVPSPDQRHQVYEFLRRKLAEGRQAYVVCPLVGESERIDLASAEVTYDDLRAGSLGGFRVGLIHGRMSEPQKEDVMRDFRTGETQVLVSTVVIEVGLDVANATLLVVEHADRFGLAQLHQLRGRISRGPHPGYCFLFGAPTNEQAVARLHTLERITDGFAIAEADARHRGPGELLGTRQHGFPELRIGDLFEDIELLRETRQDARALLAHDPGLRRAEHAPLRAALLARYGGVLDLADVG